MAAHLGLLTPIVNDDFQHVHEDYYLTPGDQLVQKTSTHSARYKIELVFEVEVDPRKFNEDENGHTPEEPLRYGFMLTQSKRGPLHDYVPSCIAHNDCLEIAIGNLVLVDGIGSPVQSHW